VQSLSPQDLVELGLVDQIVSAYWRLRRVQAAEQFLHETRAEQIEEAAENEQQRLGKVLMGVEEDDEDDGDENKIRQRQKRLTAIHAGKITAAATLAIVCGDEDQSFDRLSRYEQRLTGQVHRCLRDLEKLRQRKRRRLKFTPSPFAAQALAVMEDASSRPRNERSKTADQTHGTLGKRQRLGARQRSARISSATRLVSTALVARPSTLKKLPTMKPSACGSSAASDSGVTPEPRNTGTSPAADLTAATFPGSVDFPVPAPETTSASANPR
jgi:hypothetical protein